MNPFGLIVVAFGILSIYAAAYNWDWFINRRRAQFLLVIFSRTGARVICGILGFVYIVIGVLITLGLRAW